MEIRLIEKVDGKIVIHLADGMMQTVVTVAANKVDIWSTHFVIADAQKGLNTFNLTIDRRNKDDSNKDHSAN